MSVSFPEFGAEPKTRTCGTCKHKIGIEGWPMKVCGIGYGQINEHDKGCGGYEPK